MDASSWALYAVLAAFVIAGTVLHYRHREPDGPGRRLLGLLRGSALAVLLLLLFDPVVPTGATGSGGGTIALVDRSASMALPVAEGGTRREQAVAVLRDRNVGRVLSFGTGPARRVPHPGSIRTGDQASRLSPALRAAVEAGASRVLVISDGGIGDARDAAEVAAVAGLPVEVERVGRGTLPNLGITELSVPRWLESGEEAVARVTIAGVGLPATAEAGASFPDTVEVTLLVNGQSVSAASVPAPAEGRTVVAELRFTPGTVAGERVRVEAVVGPGGSMEGDDRRTAYARVGEEAAGVALVSFRPDQEPRFLLPVLERALGLPTRGWLALPGDRYIRVGRGPGAGTVSQASAVRDAVAAADLVVLHGVGPGAPAWGRDALASAERLLVLPGPDAAESLPVEVPGPVEGEWYVSRDVPPSPIAPFLAGAETATLPPLTSLRPVEPGPGLHAPLRARLTRRGEAAPVAVMGVVGGRRVAVALGDGYWRWAFADADARDVYQRFWSGVAAWLMEDGAERPGRLPGPTDHVVGRSERIDWAAPPSADSLRVRLDPTPGGAAGREPDAVGETGDAGAPDAPGVDTVLALEGGRATLEGLAPGEYAYVAEAGGVTGEGRLTVEAFSTEWTDPSSALDLESALGEPGPDGRPGAAVGSGAEAGAGRPLHATPWPYGVVLLLLCVEWVLRRRWGLR